MDEILVATATLRYGHQTLSGTGYVPHYYAHWEIDSSGSEFDPDGWIECEEDSEPIYVTESPRLSIPEYFHFRYKKRLFKTVDKYGQTSYQLVATIDNETDANNFYRWLDYGCPVDV